jgi:hypothetical protein
MRPFLPLLRARALCTVALLSASLAGAAAPAPDCGHEGDATARGACAAPIASPPAETGVESGGAAFDPFAATPAAPQAVAAGAPWYADASASDTAASVITALVVLGLLAHGLRKAWIHL